MHTDPNCIFCKIVAGQIPSKKVYEDEELIAFNDIHPAAPVHVLLVPRLARDQGAKEGQEGGFRVVINNGRDGGQEVFHLHMHIMGGPRPWTRMA
jgi:histidine triad (HIT) family protein